jgi:hypothetical protein
MEEAVMSTKDTNTGTKNKLTLGRRSLLKIAGATTLALPLSAYLGRAPWRGPRPARAEAGPRTRESYWRDGYFVHENVDTSRLDEGIIRARVDGEWQEYVNRHLSDDFIDWNLGARLEILRNMMGGGTMCLDGPHSGCLATYGANRGDSRFSLNAAFKGFGMYPVESRIEDLVQEVRDNWDASMMTKMRILMDFYEDREMWDYRFLSSLELYTSQEFETHSFLNQMANPVATINWLAIPGSFEVRAIARLIHPQDPDISDMDFLRLQWVNMMHDFYHGGDLPDPENLSWIGCIYYVVEVFDNSPYPGPMGVRSQPPL